MNQIKTFFRSIIPRPIKYILANLLYFPRDFIDLLLGRRDFMIPPTRLMFDGSRNGQ
ncbi:MAG: hypothetical protein M1480_08325 [Bacteroidetes bacterium]|nr:hypothetical protein [Bacteroidota bacterium]